jgi:hypothetical protein
MLALPFSVKQVENDKAFTLIFASKIYYGIEMAGSFSGEERRPRGALWRVGISHGEIEAQRVHARDVWSFPQLGTRPGTHRSPD